MIETRETHEIIAEFMRFKDEQFVKYEQEKEEFAKRGEEGLREVKEVNDGQRTT